MAETPTPAQQTASDALDAAVVAVHQQITDLLIKPLQALGYDVEIKPRNSWNKRHMTMTVWDLEIPRVIGSAIMSPTIAVEFEMKTVTKGPRWSSAGDARTTTFTGTTMYKHRKDFSGHGDERPRKLTPERATEIITFITDYWFRCARTEARAATEKAEGIGPRILAALTAETPVDAKRDIFLGNGAHIGTIVVTDTYQGRKTVSHYYLDQSTPEAPVLTLSQETTTWTPGTFRHAL